MRLIDADALLTVPNVRKVTEYDETGEGITYLAVPVEAIEKAPTIEAEPVRHGKWEEGAFENSKRCSVCQKYATKVHCHSEPIFDYERCPYCGAKMDLEG